jgi:hypothetical protein
MRGPDTNKPSPGRSTKPAIADDSLVPNRALPDMIDMCGFTDAEIERLAAADNALVEALDTESWNRNITPAAATWKETRHGA